MKFSLYYIVIIILSCNEVSTKNSVLTKDQFLNSVNIDSLVFNNNENTYFDKYGEGSGSLYKFDSSDMLSFYCFLNGKAYPYAEYFNEKGEIIKTDGRPSLRNIYEVNSDSSYTFSFLFSTFRKSDYQVQSIVNMTDTLNNKLLQAADFSNVGGFSIVVRTKEDVLKTTIINHVSFYDSVRKVTSTFFDTISLKNVVKE
jgi:hypothetical protein